MLFETRWSDSSERVKLIRISAAILTAENPLP